MKVALIGAGGFVGSALLREALTRGHTVTAMVLHPDKLAPRSNLTARKTDVLDTDRLASQLSGYDAAISAFSGHAADDVYGYYMKGIRSIITATAQAGVRLLVVGGAGSLEVAPGVQLLDTPGFPAQWKATAEGARQALSLLRDETGLDWTMLSPSAMLEPGLRTGKFRLGTDRLLIDNAGESRISLEDYAVAMIDELEQPAHRRQRFTVGY
jgi:putative NADH-flavin reductase